MASVSPLSPASPLPRKFQIRGKRPSNSCWGISMRTGNRWSPERLHPSCPSASKPCSGWTGYSNGGSEFLILNFLKFRWLKRKQKEKMLIKDDMRVIFKKEGQNGPKRIA